ncbi:hypothetical protein B0T25DRAFT_583619 [Lasiosphaeria hispida]|uniref:Uncharacterized protein n=1 Tax=Lasiosphaeria hispida TaxID=260671 RepID=A0AAJ0HB84_9PEZI|nr:hypothetical protein B0T25DRAFT_583619 [Lasiosphaeria hispida]
MNEGGTFTFTVDHPRVGGNDIRPEPDDMEEEEEREVFRAFYSAQVLRENVGVSGDLKSAAQRYQQPRIAGFNISLNSLDPPCNPDWHCRSPKVSWPARIGLNQMVGPYNEPFTFRDGDFDVTCAFAPEQQQQIEHHDHQQQYQVSSSVTPPDIDNLFTGDDVSPQDIDRVPRLQFGPNSFTLHPLKPAPPPPLNTLPHITTHLPPQDPFSVTSLLVSPIHPSHLELQPNAQPSDPSCTIDSLRHQLQQTARERGEARMAVSALRNEMYAARQVEKRLRAERDDARGQVLFLRREGRVTEGRLRRERNEARVAAVVVAAGRGKGRRGREVEDGSPFVGGD